MTDSNEYAPQVEQVKAIRHRRYSRKGGRIFRRGNSWYGQYDAGVKLVDGQPKRDQKCVKLADYCDRYRCKADVQSILDEKMGRAKAARNLPTSATSFGDYVERAYFPAKEGELKPSTLAGYKTYYHRYLKPLAGALALRDFDIARTSRLLADIAQNYAVNRASLAKCRSVLCAIFTYALTHGDYPGKSESDNPARGAALPRATVEAKATKAPSRDDVAKMLTALKGKPLERAIVAVCALTGVRPGEARAMCWENWNRETNEILIDGSTWHGIDGTTKTPQSRRFVTVTPELATILRDLRSMQGHPLTGYVLAHADGTRANLDNLSKRVIAPAMVRCAICGGAEASEHKEHAFRRDEKMPQWAGYYSLRRFHGTMVRTQSGSSDTASKALGNSKDVLDRHYLKPAEVLPDVRRAVTAASKGILECDTDVIRHQQGEASNSFGMMAGTTGLEPATSAVTGQRSNQLNYVPKPWKKQQA